MLTFGISGMVHNGADVGGFFRSADANLQARWHQVGAWTYPFFRNHAHHRANYREIYRLEGEEATVAREAVVDRYRLLPYWYTLARHAHLTGEPLVRALWWEFPEDRFIDVDDRVMVGSALFVVPFLAEEPGPVAVQLPAGARWYCYRTLREILSPEEVLEYNGGRTAVFLRGGSVVAVRRELRKSSGLMLRDPVTLMIGIDGKGHAAGELYLDDGESFDFAQGGFVLQNFVLDGDLLTGTATGNRTSEFVQGYDAVIDQIQIAGLAKVPSRIADGKGETYEFDVADGVVTIHDAEIALKDDFRITME
jgi:alpha 1,3-glucosidase